MILLINIKRQSSIPAVTGIEGYTCRRKEVKKMDMYLVQIIQNKVLCGIELSETEKAILKKYEQSTNDVFDNWLAIIR